MQDLTAKIINDDVLPILNRGINLSDVAELVDSAREWLANGTFTFEGRPEALTRQYLINPLLSILGWDASPSSEYHFVPEFSGGMSRRWEDMVLMHKDMPIIFVECKNLLTDNILTRYNVNELLNYMKEYNRVNKFGHRIDWGILTNFRKMYFFYVSDKEPFLTFDYETYIDKFDFIKELISTEGIVKDGIAHYFSENRKEELGEQFLQDLKKWRLVIANGLYECNDDLSIEQLKITSQKFIDRLIFIRMLETLGIIPYNWLRTIYIKWREGIIGLNKTYSQVLKEEFINIESLYDTELFIKSLVDELEINDVYLNELLKIEVTMDPTIARKIGFSGPLILDDKGLYGYNFKTLSIDIMGSAYERYLAHNIIIKNEVVQIEETAELRKKEGIYYTPKHIVDYIVDKTLSTPLLNILTKSKSCIDEENYSEAKTIIESIKNIKILDPACGSGSFLITAFDKIYDTYCDYNEYFQNKVKGKLESGGLDQFLTIGFDNLLINSIGERVLLDNLYGVDYDPQAVEITKLNLWLKMLSASPELYRPEVGVTHKKYLPSLILKIKCGNSICPGINEEILEDAEINTNLGKIIELRNTLLNLILKTTPLFAREVDLDELLQEILGLKEKLETINVSIRDKLRNTLIHDGHFKEENGKLQNLSGSPFHWELEFPEVFTSDGFDIVLGNPPHGAKLTKEERNFIGQQFSLGSGTKNTAYIFIELSKRLLNESGLLGLVIPKSLLFSQDWGKVRDYLLGHTNINEIVDISKAFKGVLLEQVIIIAKNHDTTTSFNSYILNEENAFTYCNNIPNSIYDESKSFPISIDEMDMQIFTKMVSDSINFGDITETFRGFPLQSRLSDTRQESFEPTLRGDDIKRFSNNDPSNFLSSVNLVEKPKYHKIKNPKLITQRIVAHIENPIDHIAIMSTIDFNGYLNVDTVENTVLTDDEYDYHYLLGLLNSRLIGWYIYKFVFCDAIRTMDFDEYYVNKICLKSISDASSAIIDKIKTDVSDILILCNQKRWLFDSFIALQKVFSLTDELKIGYFIDVNRAQEFGIDLISLHKIDGDMTGTIKEYSVNINEDTISIHVKILEENNYINALSFKVNNETCKNYMFLSLKTQEGRKSYRSQRNILNTIYDDFKIPVLVSRNYAANIEAFNKLLQYMEEAYEQKLEKEWINSKIKIFQPHVITNNVKSTDEIINESIFRIFNLSNEEIQHVNENTTSLTRLT